MVDVDWNATVLILDTLSEDIYSFTQLGDYICRHYGRDVALASLAWLAGQDLIRVLEGPPHEDAYAELHAEERSKRLERFFEIGNDERQNTVANWIDLTPKGKDLLRLIGIGHPPL